MISGKEAIEAFLNGDDVEFMDKTGQWRTMFENTILKVFLDHDKFRIKPKRITINGIEVPAPFEPKDGDIFYILSTSYECGYVEILCYRNDKQGNMLAQFGAWRTEEEIKQVVEALRQIFK